MRRIRRKKIRSGRTGYKPKTKDIKISTVETQYVTIWIENINWDAWYSEGTFDVYINNNENIGGFQLEFSGISIINVSGELAETYNFVLNFDQDSILGYSMTGTSIPASDGVLVRVSFSSTTNDQVCFTDDTTFSSAPDPELGQSSQELSIQWPYGKCFFEVVKGCTDETMWNYDSDANMDDGSCIEEICMNINEGANFKGIPLEWIEHDGTFPEVFFPPHTNSNHIQSSIHGILGGITGALWTGNNYIGSLHYLHDRSGYWFIANTEVNNACFYGKPVYNQPYNLDIGANMVSYDGPDGMSFPAAIAGTCVDVDGSFIVQEQVAAIKINGIWYSGITEFKRNRGYWFVVHEYCTFTFNLETQSNIGTSSPVYFNFDIPKINENMLYQNPSNGVYEWSINDVVDYMEHQANTDPHIIKLIKRGKI